MSGTADPRILVRIEASQAQLQQQMQAAERAVQASAAKIGSAMAGAGVASAQTSAAFARATAQIRENAERAARAVEGYGAAQDAASRNTGRFGQAMGQAGYQIQDFATQVSMGQNALVAFSTQFAQFAGVFGTAGAIAGAAVTVGVLAAQLLGAADANRRLEEALGQAAEGYRRGTELGDRYREGLEQEERRIMSLRNAYAAMSVEQREYERRQLEATQKALEEQRVAAVRAAERELTDIRRIVDRQIAEAREQTARARRSNPNAPAVEIAPDLRAGLQAIIELSNAGGPALDTLLRLSERLRDASLVAGPFAEVLRDTSQALDQLIPGWRELSTALQRNSGDLAAVDRAAAEAATRTAALQPPVQGTAAAIASMAGAAQGAALAIASMAGAMMRAQSGVTDLEAEVQRQEAELRALATGGVAALRTVQQEQAILERVARAREAEINDLIRSQQKSREEAVRLVDDVARAEARWEMAQRSIVNQASIQRFTTTLAEAGREGGARAGREATQAFDQYFAPQRHAGSGLLLLSDEDKRAADEIMRQMRETNRDRERSAQEIVRQAERAEQQLDRQAERFGGSIADALVDGLFDGSRRGQTVLESLANSFRRVLASAAAQALNAAVFTPAARYLLGGSSGGGSAPSAAAGGAPAGQQAGLGSVMSGDGLSGLGGIGRFFSGSGAWYQPGYQFSTGIGLADRALNVPLFSGGAELYGPAAGSVPTAPLYNGVSLGQLGTGVLGIAGGAYGIYSGIQTGGARGLAQGVGGAAGVAGGAAGLATLMGAGGAALAAVATVAPYIAAIAAIAAMFLPGQKPSNAAAGAWVDLASSNQVLMDSGKSTPETRGARDALVSQIRETTDVMSRLLGGIRPQSAISFEVGSRDSSRFYVDTPGIGPQQVATAELDDQAALTAAFETAMMEALRRTPGLNGTQNEVIQASGNSLAMAQRLLEQVKQITDTYGPGALDRNRNAVTRDLVAQAGATGNIENLVRAIGVAADLSQRYSDELLNSANALHVINRATGDFQQKLADLEWTLGTYQQLVMEPKEVSAVKVEMDALRDSYRQAADRARDLGLATDVLFERMEARIREMREAVDLRFGGAMRELQGLGVVDQLLGFQDAVAGNRRDLRAANLNPNRANELYRQQITSAIEGMDVEQLRKVADALREVSAATGQNMGDALAIIAQNIAKLGREARQASRVEFDAALRDAQGLGSVNAALDLIAARDANRTRFAAAGRDVNQLFAAQIQSLAESLDTESLRRTVVAMRNLDAGAAQMLEAALLMRDAAEQQEEAAERMRRLTDAGGSIRGYLDSLETRGGAGASPAEQLAAARRVYGRDLALGGRGNLEAIGRLPGGADAYLEAARQMYGSGPQYQAILAQVRGGLAGLPATQSYDAQILQELRNLGGRIEASVVFDLATNLRLAVEGSTVLTADQRTIMLAVSENVERVLRFTLAGAAGFTPAQREIVQTTAATLARQLTLAVRGDSGLTEPQREIIRTTGADLARILTITVNGDAGFTVAEREIVQTRGASLLHSLRLQVAGDAALSASRREILEVAAANIERTLTLLVSGSRGLSDAQREILAISAANLARILTLSVAGASQLTARQREIVETTGGAVSRLLQIAVTGAPGLTLRQREMLGIASAEVVRALDILVTGSAGLTEAQRQLLAVQTATATRILTLATRGAAGLTAAQREIALASTATVVRTLTLAVSGETGLTPAQREIVRTSGGNLLRSLELAVTGAAAFTPGQRQIATTAAGNFARTLELVARGGGMTIAQRDLLLAETGAYTRALELVTSGGGLTQDQRTSLTTRLGAVSRTLSLAAQGGGMTAAQQALVTAQGGQIARTLVLAATNPALTADQRAALTATAGQINRQIRNNVETTETVQISRSVDERIANRLDMIQRQFYAPSGHLAQIRWFAYTQTGLLRNIANGQPAMRFLDFNDYYGLPRPATASAASVASMSLTPANDAGSPAGTTARASAGAPASSSTASMGVSAKQSAQETLLLAERLDSIEAALKQVSSDLRRANAR